MSYELRVKWTVSRDGRGYKSGIHPKVSLNPINSEATKVILLKGQLASYVYLKDLVLYLPSIVQYSKLHGLFQIAVFLQLAPFGIRSLASVLSVIFAKYWCSKLLRLLKNPRILESCILELFC